jgi:hypothetical protein
MRNNEEKGFTSEVDWATLKVGPNSIAPPSKEKKKEGKAAEKSDESIHEELPF